MLLVSVLLVIAAIPFSANARSSGPVGFQTISVPNGSEPALRVAVWYPTDAAPRDVPLESFKQLIAKDGRVTGRRLPLVVISHGGGGTLAGHYDTALALARAGFVVAALDHTGDTLGDESQVLKLWRRPRQLERLVTYMLDEWPDHGRIALSRVGAFGFSNGGFTVLAAAGGRPDLRRTAAYCAANPDHDLCAALRRAGVAPTDLPAVPADAWTRDDRIRAIAVAAPAFGFAFAGGGLDDVRVPVQLWRAADDRHQPNPWYDEAVRTALPRKPEMHVVADAGHYDFLAPCSASLAKAVPMICAERPGFDRSAFHARFNRDLIRFFRKNLR